MNLYARVGMYLFIIGSLLTVLASSFEVGAELLPLVWGTLVFAGVFAGLMNITADEESKFMLSVGVFLVALLALDRFASFQLPFAIGKFYRYATLFLGSMVFAIATRSIIDMGSLNEIVSPQERWERQTRAIERWQLSRAQRAWHFIIFLTVALTFILILVDLFALETLPPLWRHAILIADWLVILIFLADLVVLYLDEENRGQFLKKCWPDIIAAVPVPASVFGILKSVRVIRFLRIARAAHAGELAKFTQSSKFFSTQAGIDHYLDSAQTAAVPPAPVEHAAHSQHHPSEHHAPEADEHRAHKAAADTSAADERPAEHATHGEHHSPEHYAPEANEHRAHKAAADAPAVPEHPVEHVAHSAVHEQPAAKAADASPAHPPLPELPITHPAPAPRIAKAAKPAPKKPAPKRAGQKRAAAPARTAKRRRR